MRAALYARVSTSDKGQDTANQLPELRRLAGEHGYQVREYIEEETATGKRRRPIFEQMLADAEAGRFQVLLVWALDRLTREGPLPAMLILDRLARAGVRVRSLKEPWLDPASPTYDLLLPIFAWIARQEATRIRERVLAGMARARSQGKRIGRPVTGAPRDKVATLRAQGLSWAQVSAQTGYDVSSCRNALRRAC